MSQHIPPHHFHNHLAAHIPPSPTQYIHYQNPPLPSIHQPSLPQNHTIAPQDTTRHPLNSLPSPLTRSPPLSSPSQNHVPQHFHHQRHSGAPLTNGIPNSGPLVATGDWTKDLIHLAKTAE